MKLRRRTERLLQLAKLLVISKNYVQSFESWVEQTKQTGDTIAVSPFRTKSLIYSHQISLHLHQK